ncbi:hypothetical protein GOBAR_AA02390 [Gossypium barbadense]|uniref:Uncharacterized protein n=1 Tax=Gossypium barbadense TaxID=3634 RepID=A0A2P5YRK6_GOSBA|nr:hypothetical protein GOBAR_AA02390 [Gossypium barbadense]
MEDAKNPPPQQLVSSEKEELGKEEEPKTEEQLPASTTAPNSGGGWGGWGFSAFSVLSDLQKAATVAAEEISRNEKWYNNIKINKCPLKHTKGLKVFDNSVENFASGAWQALGSAWKGGTNFVQNAFWMQASVVAEKAAKSIADIQIAEESESSKADEAEESPSEKESEDEDEDDKLRKSALDKLEKASGDSFLGQARFEGF